MNLYKWFCVFLWEKVKEEGTNFFGLIKFQGELMRLNRDNSEVK